MYIFSSLCIIFFVIPSSLFSVMSSCSVLHCHVNIPCHMLSCHHAMPCIVMSLCSVMNCDVIIIPWPVSLYCHIIIPFHVLSCHHTMSCPRKYPGLGHDYTGGPSTALHHDVQMFVSQVFSSSSAAREEAGPLSS